MKIVTTESINDLRQLFRSVSLPKLVVSDNRPKFSVSEFQNFMKSYRKKHICNAPYHPISNVLVERLLQTFMKSIKASRNDGLRFNQQLHAFLISYRTILTNQAPS